MTVMAGSKRQPKRARTRPSRKAQRYVVVGLGGIGSHVLRLLTQFLHSERSPTTVVAIDGDVFEERNRARMRFERLGPKALVLAKELAEDYGDVVSLLPIPRYLTRHNAGRLIANGDVVFCQPDNHSTRRLAERRCMRLSDITLFSAGNDGVENGKTGTYGNVQVYLRQGGHDLTNPISRFHPEIARPADRGPSEQGCGAATATAPQLLFTNASVAAAMLSAFYAWRLGRLSYEEVYLDTLPARMVAVQRELAGKRKVAAW